jgi:hypothetical protein
MTNATDSTTTTATSDPVVRYLDDLAAGRPLTASILADDVVLDATVPNWRLERRGRDEVTAQLAEWYASDAHYDWVRRQHTPTGELVEFFLCWEEDGVPFAVHQLHLLDLEDGRIHRDTMFCGGRWSAALLAEMEAAHA